MPAPHDKLAESLAELRRLQVSGGRVFASKELSRTHRERLVKHGFLLEIMNGWLVATSPATRDGDTTPWFSAFWEFCRRYCRERFGESWHLSPEQSLLIHAENTVIPKQVIVFSPSANNLRTDLAFKTSLFAVKEPALPPDRMLEEKNGLRIYTAEAALTRVPVEFFTRNAIDARIILERLHDPSRLLALLLDGGHSTVAGRLAGAFRHIGNDVAANEIVAAMKSADFQVHELDPFSDLDPGGAIARAVPPVVLRLKELWRRERDGVIAEMLPPPGLPKNRRDYMQTVEDAYETDAYHSLSIEAFFIRKPDENHEAFYRWLLERNARMYAVAFAIDNIGDVYLVGKLPLTAVTPDEIDRILGSVLTYSDEGFDTALELGFRSSIEKEWDWRVKRGESLRNLEAFAKFADPANRR